MDIFAIFMLIALVFTAVGIFGLNFTKKGVELHTIFGTIYAIGMILVLVVLGLHIGGAW